MLFISDPDQSTVRAAMTELSADFRVIPVHAFPDPRFIEHDAAIKHIGKVFFIFYPFVVVCIILWLRTLPNRNECVGVAHHIFYLQKVKTHYIIHRALGHSLMVEHRTLTPSVLVRIQLPQPKFQNLPIGASFLLFYNTSSKFESLVLKMNKFLPFSNFLWYN